MLDSLLSLRHNLGLKVLAGLLVVFGADVLCSPASSTRFSLCFVHVLDEVTVDSLLEELDDVLGDTCECLTEQFVDDADKKGGCSRATFHGYDAIHCYYIVLPL